MDIPSVAVIMAGGTGERFWPLSRKNRPKQILYLTSDELTMLEEAVDRLIPLIPVENIYIATSKELKQPIQESLSHVPPENIIGEPLKRNTGGCLAFAVSHIQSRFANSSKDVLMSVVTADHLEIKTDFKTRYRPLCNLLEKKTR
jgi:mannose-1-phosphate guanylyltransferase